MTVLPRPNTKSLHSTVADKKSVAQRFFSLFRRACFFTAAFVVALTSVSVLAIENTPSGDAIAQEFRNVKYNYYFLTNKASEKAILLAQNTPSTTVWESTGQYIRIYPKATDNINAKGLRRFQFSSTFTGAPYSSHVYVVSPSEIALVNATMATNAAKIFDESNDGYVLESDIGAIGEQPSCVKGQTPVWRAFNAGRFHHRYTTDFGFYADTILANLPGDMGWAKDNEEIKFCAVEAAMHYGLKVETTAVSAGNTMAVRVTVMDSDATVLSGGAATTQQVRVNIQLPPELAYLSDDLAGNAKCAVQLNKSGTALSCIANVSSGGQSVFNLSTTVAATNVATKQAIQAAAVSTTGETNVDPRQCTGAARPSFGCAIGVAAVVNTSKSVSFSPAVASASSGTSTSSWLAVTAADQKLTSVSVFAPTGVGISDVFNKCVVGETITNGTKYTCAFSNPTLAISVTASAAGNYVLWTVIPGASAAAADACLVSPTPSGCARLELSAIAPSSPVALAISAFAPPDGTVNSSYAWQYACLNQSDSQTATNVNCTYSTLPSGLNSSCDGNQSMDLAPRRAMQCNVSGIPQKADITIFNLTASASNAQSITQTASITIKGPTVVVPPVSTAPKISDPTLTLVSGSATQGSPNTATVNYSFTSNAAQTVYLVLLEEIGGTLNSARMTGIAPAQQFTLSAGAAATGTISFSTSESPASVRLCVLPSQPGFGVSCDNPSVRVIGTAALPVSFAAPPPPAATANVTFSSQPIATAVGSTATYAVAVSQSGATAVTLPITVAFTVPNLFSVISAPGCRVAPGNSMVLNCAITAALPQTIAIDLQPQPGASTAAKQLFALAIAGSTGATTSFTCVGATPASACASSNLLTPTFYDMAAQSFALPGNKIPSVLECKNIGTRATESSNLTCTVELTYQDSTTKATSTTKYQIASAAALQAGASLPLIKLYDPSASQITTSCGSTTNPSTAGCDVLIAPPTGNVLVQVALTTAVGGVNDGVDPSNNTKVVTQATTPPGGTSCTDQTTDQQYSYDGTSGTGGSFNPRTFRSLGQITASFAIIPGSHTITAGYPKRYNRFTWEIVGPDFVSGFQMTISPCRGDFTSADALKISLPGYTPTDNRVEYAGSIALYFDEPARPPVGTVYSMTLPSNRIWYVNMKNDLCLGNQACGTSVYFIDADR